MLHLHAFAAAYKEASYFVLISRLLIFSLQLASVMVTVNASRETAVETVRTTLLVRKMLLDKNLLAGIFLDDEF